MIWEVAHRMRVISNSPWELLCLTHSEPACLPMLTLQLKSSASLGQSPPLSASYYHYCFYGASFSTERHLDQSGI